MKKIKGIVLESTATHLILLTTGGEYIRLPSQGQNYSVGEEVEINRPLNRSAKRVLALAASIVFVIALTLILQITRQPEAYLALDINPSLVLSLDKNAEVLEVEPLNQDAETLLKDLHLEGQGVENAVSQVLDSAYQQDYLSPGRDNVILVSLAAPDQYMFTREHLEKSLAEQVKLLELDAYLKVSAASPGEARKAREDNISLNAVILDRHLEEEEPDTEVDTEAEKDLEKKPIPSVDELLRRFPLEKLFGPEEFIPGDRAPEKTPTEPGKGVGPPEKEVGPPEGVGPPEKEVGPPEKGPGRPDEVPPVEAPGRPDEHPRQGPPDDLPNDPGKTNDKGLDDKTPPGHEIAPPIFSEDESFTPPGQGIKEERPEKEEKLEKPKKPFKDENMKIPGQHP